LDILSLFIKFQARQLACRLSKVVEGAAASRNVTVHVNFIEPAWQVGSTIHALVTIVFEPLLDQGVID